MSSSIIAGTMIGLDVETLGSVARIGGGAGIFAWVLVWLLRRGDALQRENIEELRTQRDDYRERLEISDERVRALEAKLRRCGREHPPPADMGYTGTTRPTNGSSS